MPVRRIRRPGMVKPDVNMRLGVSTSVEMRQNRALKVSRGRGTGRTQLRSRASNAVQESGPQYLQQLRKLPDAHKCPMVGPCIAKVE